MAPLNVSTLLLAAVALAALIMLFTLVADSRRLAKEGPDLPLWMFLRRRGLRRDAVISRMGGRGVRVLEMRCASCGSRRACMARLGQGGGEPPPDCPNAPLFDRSTPRGGRA